MLSPSAVAGPGAACRHSGRGILLAIDTPLLRRARSVDERRLAAAALIGLLSLAVLLRMVPTLFVPSMNWADEIFQASEQAHRLVYGTGLVPWEFQLGIRSWLLPGAIAGLMELARLFGDGPDYYLPVIDFGFSALGAAPVLCAFLWGRRFFGVSGAIIAGLTVAVAPELVYFGGRTLSEVAAGNLLVVALYLLEPGYFVTARRRIAMAGALLALVFILRIQLAPAIALAAVWSFVQRPRHRLPALLLGAAIVLALAGGLDAATLGYPLASVWRYFDYNLFYGVSDVFGTEPWNYYFEGEIGLWQSAVMLLVLLVLIGARRLPMLLVCALIILLSHSAIAHKEYRFIYPAVLLAAVLAGIGLAQAVHWSEGWLSEKRVSSGVAALICGSLACAYWCWLSFHLWTGPIMTKLRDRGHDNLAAVSLITHGPSFCGLGLYGLEGADWGNYGGYTYLHRDVPIYWPKDATQFLATVAGFDTLISIKPPPAGTGFTTERCFGNVCVARRPGRCAPVPMMRMPFPAPLQGLAPHLR